MLLMQMSLASLLAAEPGSAQTNAHDQANTSLPALTTRISHCQQTKERGLIFGNEVSACDLQGAMPKPKLDICQVPLEIVTVVEQRRSLAIVNGQQPAIGKPDRM